MLYKFHDLVLNFELINSFFVKFLHLYDQDRQFVTFTGLFSESHT